MLSRILVPYHLDEFRAEFDWPLPAETVITATADAPTERWAFLGALGVAVRDTVADQVARGAVPVVLSGDCTASLGTVAGLQRGDIAPAIVWFDAHGDVQTLETTASGYVGGMPLRILVGYRPELISDHLGLLPVPEERVVLVDARDLDPPEVDYLSLAAINHVTVADVSTIEIPAAPIYLHLDVDVVTPDELPWVRFPALGGPNLAEVFAAVRAVLATGRVAAIGIACTWHPGHHAAEIVRPYLEAALS